MTDRIRSQHGNVIVGDFRPPASLNVKVSVETIYADECVIVLRCAVGTTTWHLLGDIATGQCIST